jgi:hypothetical protein
VEQGVAKLLETVGDAGLPDVLGEGGVAVGVIDAVGMAAGAIAMEGFIDADVRDEPCLSGAGFMRML